MEYSEYVQKEFDKYSKKSHPFRSYKHLYNTSAKICFTAEEWNQFKTSIYYVEIHSNKLVSYIRKGQLPWKRLRFPCTAQLITVYREFSAHNNAVIGHVIWNIK